MEILALQHRQRVPRLHAHHSFLVYSPCSKSESCFPIFGHTSRRIARCPEMSDFAEDSVLARSRDSSALNGSPTSGLNGWVLPISGNCAMCAWSSWGVLAEGVRGQVQLSQHCYHLVRPHCHQHLLAAFVLGRVRIRPGCGRLLSVGRFVLHVNHRPTATQEPRVAGESCAGHRAVAA